MASEGPATPKDAPVTLQTSAPQSTDLSIPSAATLAVATGVPPVTEEPQMKSAQPLGTGAVAAVTANHAVVATPNVASMQEMAKSQFTALNMNPKVILGEGSFKRVLSLSPGVAVAVARESGEKSLAMLNKECQYLSVLSKVGLPAISTFGDVFSIDGKERYAVLMEAMPKHTFVDGKDPRTIKTILPSILLGVDIPPGEAWFFKKAQIEKNITQNLTDPAALAAAQEKATFLFKQLEDIRVKLEKNGMLVVDLQLLVDPRGVIKIIDPLEVMKFGPKPGTYLTLDNSPVETSGSFKRSIHDTHQMLMEMIKFCHAVSTVSDKAKLKSLITPLLDAGSAASLDGERPVSARASMPSRFFSANDGKASASPLDSIAKDLDLDAIPRAPKAPSVSATKGGGYRPSSRAGGLIFSQMPPPIPLPVPKATDNPTPPAPTADKGGSSPSAHN